jgi:enterochelin esterase-like enzyme
MDLETYESLGLHLALGDVDPDRVVNGRSNLEIIPALWTSGDRHYHPCPDAYVREGVAKGTTREFEDWTATGVFAGTKRDVLVYLPPNFDPTGAPPSLLVCNDGGAYADPGGKVRAMTVLDNLLARQKIEPTVAVFVNPGRPIDGPSRKQLAPGERDDPRAVQQRSVEYDTVNDRYARFLVDDLLPFVESEIDCALTTDPTRRIVAGISSGGICALSAAWFRPDSFGRVMSHCGSFTAIRGGHNYPYLIRSTPRKPIRVWMQSGEHDADILTGNWPLANKEVAAALAFAGYDVNFVFGEGGHNLAHGGALFADALRWLWSPPA